VQNFQALQFHASLFGKMAEGFGGNLIDTARDKEPSVAKTVKRIVGCMKQMFFDLSNDNVRSQCSNSLYLILECCF